MCCDTPTVQTDSLLWVTYYIPSYSSLDIHARIMQVWSAMSQLSKAATYLSLKVTDLDMQVELYTGILRILLILKMK